MRQINYEMILANTREIINALEHDCERSGGKVKFNVTTLNELYKLEETLVAKAKPVKKTPVKEG